MKLIIAGTRTYSSILPVVDTTMYHCFNLEPAEVVCGGAAGADKAGEIWAGLNGIPVKYFPADWDKHGKAAGPIRNKQMAQYGDALLLVWDGESRGSANMRKEMLALGKPVYEVIIKTHDPKFSKEWCGEVLKHLDGTVTKGDSK